MFECSLCSRRGPGHRQASFRNVEQRPFIKDHLHTKGKYENIEDLCARLTAFQMMPPLPSVRAAQAYCYIPWVFSRVGLPKRRAGSWVKIQNSSHTHASALRMDLRGKDDEVPAELQGASREGVCCRQPRVGAFSSSERSLPSSR